jgi:hypothetical protein
LAPGIDAPLLPDSARRPRAVSCGGMAAAPLFPMNLNDVTLTKWDRKFINAFSTVYKCPLDCI